MFVLANYLVNSLVKFSAPIRARISLIPKMNEEFQQNSRNSAAAESMNTKDVNERNIVHGMCDDFFQRSEQGKMLSSRYSNQFHWPGKIYSRCRTQQPTKHGTWIKGHHNVVNLHYTVNSNIPPLID